MRAFGFAALVMSASLAPTLALAAGKPANLCRELVAFLHSPAAAPATPDTKSTTAVQAPGTGSSTPKPAADGDPQKNSGLSGPTATSGPGASGPQGGSQNAAAPSGAAAAAPSPAAPAVPPPPPPKAPSAASIEEGDAAAAADDIAACQRVARQMRRTGVVMPAPLMSLAAMDLPLLEAGR